MQKEPMGIDPKTGHEAKAFQAMVQCLLVQQREAAAHGVVCVKDCSLAAVVRSSSLGKATWRYWMAMIAVLHSCRAQGRSKQSSTTAWLAV